MEKNQCRTAHKTDVYEILSLAVGRDLRNISSPTGCTPDTTPSSIPVPHQRNIFFSVFLYVSYVVLGDKKA